MKRTESREAIFLLLFQASFRKDEEASEILAGSVGSMELETDEYAEKAFNDIIARLDEIDSEITPFLVGRTLERLSRIALTALRIAVYEIKYSDDVPDSVAINEAVELVKKYDIDTAASAYINGVLGSYVRSR